MSMYLGIDGGGSKTTCVIGDDTSVLGSATAGGCNVARVGEQQARASIQQAIRGACVAADIGSERVIRACIGLAGVSSPSVRDLAREAVREFVTGDILVAGDMEIAFEAAFGSGQGLVVVAGTGSIAYGRNAQGVTARAGGHGPTTSDEGSGHWIGRTAVSALLQPKEQAQKEHRGGTLLLTATQIALGVRTTEELEKMSKTSPPPNFAELFPEVCATAQAGDELAHEVLELAGGELAKLADEVIGKLWPRNHVVRVALVGGVFKHSPIVRQFFCRSLREMRPNATISMRVIDPVLGALALARKGVCEQAHS